MTSADDPKDDSKSLAPGAANVPMVTRSAVVPKDNYLNYKEELRYDFWHSCAYCTTSEIEAGGVRFTIDHYEPRKSRPDLEHQYSNLMYACDPCNMRKSDRCPPDSARAQGLRFFRPDEDIHVDHYDPKGVRLEAKSNVGYFTIEALDLNRLPLRKLRELRMRLSNCDRIVAEGIAALRGFPLDKLPAHVKGAAARTIAQAVSMGQNLEQQIDSVLRDYAKSAMIDPDPESDERARQRAAVMKDLRSLFPGTWRAPRQSK